MWITDTMYLTEINNACPLFAQIQAYLSQFVADDKVYGNNFIIPDSAVMLVGATENIDIMISQIMQMQGQDQIDAYNQMISCILGAVVIHNFRPARGTAEISFCKTGNHQFFNIDMTYNIYEYLFEFLKLRKVNCRIPASHKATRYHLHKFGYHETHLPYEIGPNEDEYVFYYEREQWVKARKTFSGEIATLKRNNWKLAQQKEL